MSDVTFRTVLRGYDPAEVERTVGQLRQAADQARAEAADRTAELTRLHGQVAELEARIAALHEERAQAAPPSFAELGARVGRILSLAEAEAKELVGKARAEAAATAAELERTLAERHEKAAVDFAEQLAANEAAIARAEEHRAAIDAEAERIRIAGQAQAEAIARAAQEEAEAITRAAQDKAVATVSAARDQAEKVRRESDRELQAATSRRDAITAQLANVRQMLATLGETSVADPLAQPDPAP